MVKRKRRLGALMAEGFMVLVGVLGAFLLEGWRSDRELAREVRQELQSIEGELRRNRDAVEAEIESLRRVTEGGQALADRIQATPEGSILTIPDTLLFLAAVWNPTYNASLGAVEALLASGRLAEIGNPDLRLGLAGLDDAIVDASEEEVFARAITVENLAPELDDALNWPSFEAVLSEFFGAAGDGESPQGRAVGRPIPGTGSVDLVASRRIGNLVLRRVLWQRAAIGEFRRFERRLGDLLTLVELELGRAPG